MRRHFLFAVLAFALIGCQPADDVAQQLLVRQCSDFEGAPVSVVAACTSLIEGKNATNEIRAFALGNRGLARGNGGDVDGALADLNRAVELQPESAHALGWRGSVHGLRGEHDASIRDLEKSLQRDPSNVIFQTNLGTAFERKGQLERALPHYDRAIELDPSFKIAVGGRCWVLAVLNRDLDRAAADCDRALQLDSKDYNSYNSRGFVRFRQQRYAESVADYDRAIEGQQSASSFYMRGLVKRALGRNDEGDADIARGKQLEPGVAERYAKFGIAPP